MEMYYKFLKQLKRLTPIDAERYAVMVVKRRESYLKNGVNPTGLDAPIFYSGRKVVVGDRMLFGYIDNGRHKELISFHREEMGVLYRFVDYEYLPLLEKIT